MQWRATPQCDNTLTVIIGNIKTLQWHLAKDVKIPPTDICKQEKKRRQKKEKTKKKNKKRKDEQQK